ncbi:Hypothetical predicted protein [Olea europaea subsp. europaea]|uniref:Uncharacterized protein n=1 Tax=Olea europaea subsp. europaea TaxID=158383 RepID=A0A8S0T4C4_OLEEU|nr:Hypothetical predicted protein [Olea europaea subsp. europaea]
METFDDPQHEDLQNSCLGFLANAVLCLAHPTVGAHDEVWFIEARADDGVNMWSLPRGRSFYPSTGEEDVE